MVWQISPVPRLLSVCVCVCVCVWICVYTCMCAHMCIYVCACVYVCIHVRAYVDYLSLNGFWPQILAGEFHTREMCESWDLFADKNSLSAHFVHVFPSESPQEADDTFKTEFICRGFICNETAGESVRVGNHGDGALTLVQLWSWGYQLQVWGTEGGGCHCKLERRARQQWPSAEGPAGWRGLANQDPGECVLSATSVFPSTPLWGSLPAKSTRSLEHRNLAVAWTAQPPRGGGQAGGASGALEGIWRGKCTSTGKILHCLVDRDSRFCEAWVHTILGVCLKTIIQKYLTLAKKKTHKTQKTQSPTKMVNRRFWMRHVLKPH